MFNTEARLNFKGNISFDNKLHGIGKTYSKLFVRFLSYSRKKFLLRFDALEDIHQSYASQRLRRL